jgi:hypothetical protein
MKYIRHTERGWELEAYRQYVRDQESAFPAGARHFVLEPWHYDIQHHQCPHDSWLEKLTLREMASGERAQARHIQIEAQFLGAYHDGYFELLYDTVTEYSLGLAANSQKSVGHGDWIVDEITLEETGLVKHEILFSNSGSWSIVCYDLHYRRFPNGLGQEG